jgi:hypothetical protein
MTPMLTVSICHNVTRDPEGRHAGFSGFTPGDQMAKVFTYDTLATRAQPAGIAEDAFAAFNDAPRSGEAAVLGRQYRQRRAPAVPVGDMVVVGESALTVAPAGFRALRGTFTPVCVHEHGAHPSE